MLKDMSDSRWRMSRITRIVCLLIAGPFLLSILFMYMAAPREFGAAGVFSWLSFTAVLTLAVGVPVEWLCRGGRFSLLAMMVGVLVAAFLMWLNLTPSGKLETYGWPFVVDRSLTAVVGNVLVCLVMVLFSSAAFEWALRGLERIRENPPWASSSDGPSWRPFSQDLQEQRKRERDPKAPHGSGET